MSSSSSSATAYGSRSPSPHTPESSADSFDIAQQDIDIASWYTPEHDKSAYLQFAWNPESLFHPAKSEDDAMLQLDDLIESHAYDEYVGLVVLTFWDMSNIAAVPPQFSLC